MQNVIRAVVLHEDPVIAAGVASILSSACGVSISLPAAGEDGFAAGPANVVVADYATATKLLSRPKDGRGLQMTANVLVLTTRDREWDVRVALNAGVHGYILQGCSKDELIGAVSALGRGLRYLSPCITEHVAQTFGRPTLTARELEVLSKVSEGKCNKMIARELDIAVGTVKFHVTAVIAKLQARSRTHAVSVASQRGLIAGSPGTGIRFVPNGISAMPSYA